MGRVVGGKVVVDGEPFAEATVVTAASDQSFCRRRSTNRRSDDMVGRS
jgi:hypothetical protein